MSRIEAVTSPVLSAGTALLGRSSAWATAESSRSGRRRRNIRGPSSVAEVVELHVDGEHVRVLPEQRDRLLEIILVLAGDPQRVTLDGSLNLELAVLEQLDELLALLHRDALLERERLLYLAQRRRVFIAEFYPSERDA